MNDPQFHFISPEKKNRAHCNRISHRLLDMRSHKCMQIDLVHCSRWASCSTVIKIFQNLLQTWENEIPNKTVRYFIPTQYVSNDEHMLKFGVYSCIGDCKFILEKWSSHLIEKIFNSNTKETFCYKHNFILCRLSVVA